MCIIARINYETYKILISCLPYQLTVLPFREVLLGSFRGHFCVRSSLGTRQKYDSQVMILALGSIEMKS